MCGMRRTPCCGWGTPRCVFLPCPVHTHRDLAPFVTLSQGESKGEETIGASYSGLRARCVGQKGVNGEQSPHSATALKKGWAWRKCIFDPLLFLLVHLTSIHVYPCIYINVRDSIGFLSLVFLSSAPPSSCPPPSITVSPPWSLPPVATYSRPHESGTLQETDGTLIQSIQGDFNEGAVFKV